MADAYHDHEAAATKWGFSIIDRFAGEVVCTNVVKNHSYIEQHFFRLNDSQERIRLYRENNGRNGFYNAARYIEYWVFDPKQPRLIAGSKVIINRPQRHWRDLGTGGSGGIYMKPLPHIILVRAKEIVWEGTDVERSSFRLHFPVVPD